MALVKNRLSRSSSLRLEINRLPKVPMSLDKLKIKNKSVNSRKNWRRRASSFGATRKKKLWSKKTKADAAATDKVPLVVVMTSAPTYHSDDEDGSDVDGKHGSFEWLTQKFGTCCTADENNNSTNDLMIEWTAAQNKLENSSSVVVQETKDVGDRSEPEPPAGDRKEASSSSSGGGGKGWEWILSCCCSPPQEQIVDRVVDDRTYECTNIESGESSRSSCDDDDDEGSDESSQSSQHLAGQWLNLSRMADEISEISSSDTSDDDESDDESDDERQ